MANPLNLTFGRKNVMHYAALYTGFCYIDWMDMGWNDTG